MKVLVSDKLGSKGMDILKTCKGLRVDEKINLSTEDLKKVIRDYEGIIIRSSTNLTKEIISEAKKLKVIGRAGVGVDNVDLEEATKRGIIEDTGRNEMKNEPLIVKFNGMPGVIPALCPHDNIRLPGKIINHFSFPLISPLGTHKHNIRHFKFFLPGF